MNEKYNVLVLPSVFPQRSGTPVRNKGKSRARRYRTRTLKVLAKGTQNYTLGPQEENLYASLHKGSLLEDIIRSPYYVYLYS